MAMYFYKPSDQSSWKIDGYFKRWDNFVKNENLIKNIYLLYQKNKYYIYKDCVNIKQSYEYNHNNKYKYKKKYIYISVQVFKIG